MRPFALLVAVALAGAQPSCAGPRAEVRDSPYVDYLRLKISKVRHSIDETRDTIARSRGAPYQPELHLRLAELLSEEARYHYRVAAERGSGDDQPVHVPQVRVLKEQAIGIYQRLLREHPDSKIADQVRFNIGYEYRELNDFEKAEQAFRELIDNHSSSPYRAEALIVLGDHYFDAGDLDKSASLYSEVVDGAASRMVPLAYFKRAWVWVNQGSCKRALADFEHAVDMAREIDGDEDQTPGSSIEIRSEALRSIDVRRAALVDSVYCYSVERPAKRAVAYMRERAHDRASYVAALEKLARRYSALDEAVGSVDVVRELLVLAPAGEDRLDDARQLHGALRSLKRYGTVGSDVRLMLDALMAYEAHADVRRKQREKLTIEFEAYTRDLLTRAQSRLAGVPDKGRADYLTELAAGYEHYLGAFPNAKKRSAMLLNSADVLAEAGRHFESGQRFLEAVAAVRDAAKRRDALYDAVVQLQEGLRSPASAGDHSRRVVARGALRRSASELLRYKMSDDQRRTVELAIAMTYYDEGNYRAAIVFLSAVAYEFPHTPESAAAIRLVLDSYNTVNDYNGLRYAGQRFLAKDGPADDELRTQIQPIVAAAEQRMLDEMSLEAAGAEGVGLDVVVAFARQHRGSNIGQRALLNAFVAARAAGDSEQMFHLGAELTRDYGESEDLAGVLLTLGQTALARFEMTRAREVFDRATRGDHPQRLRLLIAAGELAENLGDTERASARYEDAASAGKGPDRADALRHLANLLEKAGDPAALIEALGSHAADGGPDVLARLGVAQVATGDIENAEKTLQLVLDAGGSASPGALARAQYGMAEVLTHTLGAYPELADLGLVEEYVTIADAAMQSYLTAARQGDADYAAASFGRIAYVARTVAKRLEQFDLPSGLSGADKTAVRKALAARVAQQKSTAHDAIASCANLAWSHGLFTPTVRGCLDGRVPGDVAVKFDRIDEGRRARLDKATKLRDRVQRNPKDVEALRQLGESMLAAGDAQAARMVFAAARDAGGGTDVLNLYGIAAYRAGDVGAGFAAFAEAAQAGLEGARQNLMAGLRDQGLREASAAAEDKLERGESGGARLFASSERRSRRGGRR